ncbi:hypothetical protein [Paracoccus rhizosphaerae]|uniref:Uncharacterized protein n=1 Tax=Paracoccus rhizosphaerae TaxID=1133347 RepID=A0ABV6CIZ5_9RHOB|nr:hypothetical protein [Paracoccus rhizosphaerae]
MAEQLMSKQRKAGQDMVPILSTYPIKAPRSSVQGVLDMHGTTPLGGTSAGFRPAFPNIILAPWAALFRWGCREQARAFIYQSDGSDRRRFRQ